MKKSIYGVLFLALVGVVFVSCEKELISEDSSSQTMVTKNNMAKTITYNYALGADVLNQELLRKKYDLNTTLFSAASTLNNAQYYGVGAYNYGLIVLEKTGTNQSWLSYESGFSPINSGVVKYLGADILMDEVELIENNINKIYGLKGGNIYKLTYNTSTTNFDATVIYSYPSSPLSPRRFSIAPRTGDQNSLRLYTALSVASQIGQPSAMTTLSYIDMEPVLNGWQSLQANVTTQIPGLGNLSSFTAKDYFNATPISSNYYIVVDKNIYNLDSVNNLVLVNSFANSVRDCSFYNR